VQKAGITARIACCRGERSLLQIFKKVLDLIYYLRLFLVIAYSGMCFQSQELSYTQKHKIYADKVKISLLFVQLSLYRGKKFPLIEGKKLYASATITYR
jgi:hypothetical protein